MKLSEFAIDHHRFTIVMVCLLVLFGFVSYITMPRSEDPQVQPAGASTVVIYPGASPSDMEALVVKPIEDVINELEDIRFLTSEASDNLAVVAVEFDPGSDSDEKYADVVQKVNSIRSQLPENILSLDVTKWSVSEVYIYQIGLTSDTAPYRILEEEAENLKDLLERIPGIKAVDLWGYPQQEVRVSVDLEKLALMGIPLTHVMGAIQDANTNIPGGHVDIGSKSLNIKTSGPYQSLNDIRYTLIHSRGGKNVFLKDVADVDFDYAENPHRIRMNGKRAVWVTATQKSGTNIFNIAGQVESILADFKDALPYDVGMELVFDQSDSVAKRMNTFFGNLMQGILLVGAIIFTAVGWRAAVIVMLAIPVSNLIGIGFVDLTGYGLEQMSIAGLVIALGLLVDNAIVVTENITRYMKLGYSRKEAAIKGTSEVSWAVVSATTTTVFAFIPIMMMQNTVGDFIRSMPTTVVYTLTASLFISLTLTPYLSSRFLRIRKAEKERPLRKLLNRFIEGGYRSLLNDALKKPWRTMILAFGALVISILLFVLFVGISFFPKAEKPYLYVNINCPLGTSHDYTDQTAQKVEVILKTYPEIRSMAVNVGHGNPRLYYNMFPKRNNTAHAQIFVTLKRFNHNEMTRLIEDMRSRFDQFPGAKIEIKELEQGPPVEAPIAINVLGERMEVLKRISKDIQRIIASQDGTVNVTNPLETTKSDLLVRINHAKANMLGIPLSEIDRTVRASMTGLSISKYLDATGKDYDIVVRLPVQGKATIRDFEKIHLASQNGSLIPLKEIATLGLQASPLKIDHFQLERSVTVTADVAGDISVRKTTENIIRELDRYTWPKGYHYYVAGEMESQEESFGGMGRAVIIAIIAIFGVLVLQFRSYTQPLVVFSALPLAIIGCVLALLITGNSFSFTAFIGFTSLVGIVVNNAIILVDFTNQLRQQGNGLIESLKTAGETRFIPIILTTATTIGGLLPLTVAGGSMWAPMGWTIIGGLLVSTFLTLVIVPVLYMLLTKNGIKAKG